MTQPLRIGGIPAESLARRHGTPLIVLDLDLVRTRIAELRAACDPYGISISYAGKAFLTQDLDGRRHQRGARALPLPTPPLPVVA